MISGEYLTCFFSLDRCLPHVFSTQRHFLRIAKPEKVPLHLHKGCLSTEGSREIIEVDPIDGWVSLNFIDASTFKATVAAIDAHQMWIYEVDGHYIEPQKVDAMLQFTGERYAALVKLDKPGKDYTVRVADDGNAQVISAFATLRYKNRVPDLIQTKGVIDYGGQNVTPVIWLDRNNLRPYPPLYLADHADTLFVFRTAKWSKAWQHTLSGGGMWLEDTTAYDPLLHNPYSETAQNDSLVVTTKNGSWVDLVIQVASFPGQDKDAPHTIHKHTTKMWQIGSGEGDWNYSSVEEARLAQPEAFNFENPNFRDTFVTGFADGPIWIVMRYQVTNPGPWMLHCHVETHLAAGMAVTILDGIDVWPEVPPEYANGRNGMLDGQSIDWKNWKNGVEKPINFEGISDASDGTTSQDNASAEAGQNEATWKGFTEKLTHFLQNWSPQRRA
jgi:hypothetical protein